MWKTLNSRGCDVCGLCRLIMLYCSCFGVSVCVCGVEGITVTSQVNAMCLVTASPASLRCLGKGKVEKATPVMTDCEKLTEVVLMNVLGYV